VVAVKGTFAINSDGSTTAAETQEEVCRVPKYFGDPGKSSLLYESELVHTKPTTDILLLGHAYSPGGKGGTQVDVTIRIDTIVKTLRVFGDRYWDGGMIDLAMSDPKPFEKIPIIYERAFGGVDQKSEDSKRHGWERRNPVGAGFAVEPKHLIGRLAPNIEDPKSLIRSWRDRPRPVGFGPIAGHWSPRVELAGTYGEKWKKERFPLLPVDFDDRYYLCSPEDQRTSRYLWGGEPVELSNLTSTRFLRFNLPRISLGFSTHFFTGESVKHRPVLHAVILEPDAPRVMMVWHSALACHPNGQKLQKTVIWQKKRVILSGREVSAH
jgi:hypothetical protein